MAGKGQKQTLGSMNTTIHDVYKWFRLKLLRSLTRKNLPYRTAIAVVLEEATTPVYARGRCVPDYLAGTVCSPRIMRLPLQVEISLNSASNSESASATLPKVAISGYVSTHMKPRRSPMTVVM